MKNKKNVLLAGVVSLGMILAGCASGSSDSGTMYGEYVYPIQDVTMDVYNHVSEMSRIESEITRLESVAIS